MAKCPGLCLLAVSIAAFVPPPLYGQTPEEEKGVLEEIGVPPSILEATLYGYIEARFEKVADSPTGPGPDGEPAFESNPHEFDVPAFHVMLQSVLLERFRLFLNLAAPGSGSPVGDVGSVVRNAWVEVPLYSTFFTVRMGKTYRRFGLYNEILDAVPDFPGIEPPELFDADHLMLTRTTNLMIHGQFNVGEGQIGYAIHSGNDERGGGQFPIGLDLRFDYGSYLRIGSSFYTSAGRAVPTRAVGEGSPNGGVINWMAEDNFFVFGGYLQLALAGFFLQTEYWQARHDARRDPAATLALLDAGLNPQQLARFGLNGPAPTIDDVVVDVNYTVQTFYARMAYEFPLYDEESGSLFQWTLTPYVQGDFYDNPETIREKDFGGDAEAGVADNGQFTKLTAGLIVRPVPAAALKIDGSVHIQEVAQQTTIYPEIRISLSYYWELRGSI